MEGVRQSNNTSKTQNETKKLEGKEKEMNIDDLDKRSAGKENHLGRGESLQEQKEKLFWVGLKNFFEKFQIHFVKTPSAILLFCLLLEKVAVTMSSNVC